MPAVDTVIDCVVAPVFQEYVYGDVPPLGLAVKVAEPPLQTVAELTDTARGVPPLLIVCWVHVAPPFVVRNIVPNDPTTIPVLASAKDTP